MSEAEAERPGELERFAVERALYAAWTTEFWIPADPDYGYVDYFEAAAARNLSLLRGFEELAEDIDRRGIISQTDSDQAKLVTDGGQAVDGMGHWSMDFEPVAASRYDGDHECQFDDCDETADWLVDCKATGYTGGRAFFCCDSCSRENRIYARENELNKDEIDADLADIIPKDEIEHVRDLQPDTNPNGGNQ